MKYIICIIILFFGGCGVVATPVDTFDRLIDMPDTVVSVLDATFEDESQRLFITAQDRDGHCSVWAYDGQFVELLNIGDSRCFGAHIFDMDDVIFVSMNTPARLYRTTDHGMTWEIVLTDVDMFWSMARDNTSIYGTLWSTDLPALYRSDDNGLSWYEWINMHDHIVSSTDSYDDSGLPQMRHLHDIVLYDDNMIVGTGDVMRKALLTTDNGDTWDEIWDEGFTTHIAEDTRIIFGADKKYGKGISVFDKYTKETMDVWTPHDGWQGYTYSMLKKDDIYYAAFHVENNISRDTMNYGILRSYDGISWYVWQQYSSDNELTQLEVVDGPENYIYVIHNGQLSYISVS